MEHADAVREGGAGAGALLATDGDGLERATLDPEGGWRTEHLLAGLDVRCVAADPARPARVFAGTQGEGVYRSLDGGASWSPSGLADATVKALAASAAEPGLVYAGTKPARLHRSHDGGESWEEVTGFRRAPGRRLWFSPAEAPGIGYVQTIALSPADPDVVHAGIEVGGVVSTFDGGATWTRAKGAIVDCHSLAAHPRDADRLYQAGAGWGAAAAESVDGGRTWRKIPAVEKRSYGWSVAADPGDAATVYWSASTGPRAAHGSGDARAGIFRRSAGRAPERLRGGLPDPMVSMPYALATDSAAPGRLLAGFHDGSLWESRDGGDSWERAGTAFGAVERVMVAVGATGQ